MEFIRASYHKINDFISFPEEDLNECSQFILGDIEIKNLDYSYNGHDLILKNINLSIKHQEKVILEGPSGSGKSTLCKLIMRMMKYDRGEILVNEVNLQDYDLQTIRSNICYISQDEVLFTDTIKENILLGKSSNDLQNVIEICQIEDILKNKPFRLETFLLEQGSNLSGGEKQRIILARGLLNDCPIIILDEALSEVSKEMEKNILLNILRNYPDRTIIYVSHHKPTNIFDRVINLEDCYE
ncbi:MAG: ABC transporter ATP-binding protein [Mollicutes bacterium]|nr:ABC transporter ATP-binding protein [Mollicutes bacterium]